MSNNTGYWKNREERAEKAKIHAKEMENRHALEIQNSVNKTKIYVPGQTYISKGVENIAVDDTDSVSAIFKYAEGKTAVLNFASYKEPGGMFLQGSYAQEENLCHASTLYNVLSRFNQNYYALNNKDKNRSLYRDKALYTPGILFECNGKSTYCDVITCAAPNKSAAQKYCFVSDAENSLVLENRIKFVLQIAASENVNTLILGAYGCGVFGQDPEEVARLFKKHLQMMHAADKVIFAIPDSSNNQNLEMFKKVFKQ